MYKLIIEKALLQELAPQSFRQRIYKAITRVRDENKISSRGVYRGKKYTTMSKLMKIMLPKTEISLTLFLNYIFLQTEKTLLSTRYTLFLPLARYLLTLVYTPLFFSKISILTTLPPSTILGCYNIQTININQSCKSLVISFRN